MRGMNIAEIDEMQSFVGKKTSERWLWHAIDHDTVEVLASTLGTRQAVVFLELKPLLSPFGITRFSTDKWGANTRHLTQEGHRIERNHLTIRTCLKRLTRKTIYSSKSIFMHDMIIGLFINRQEFNLSI